MRERDAILELWRSARSRGGCAVLATVCEVKGSAYRRPGARMLLTSGGQSAGVINGGCLDSDLWHWAREIMASGEAKLLTYDTNSPGEIVWGLGLGCRGVVKILLEPAGDLEWLRDGNSVATFFEGGRLGSVGIGEAGIERAGVVGMDGGRAFVETLKAPPHLWIFGAGADAAPLASLAAASGWAVEVIDPRPERREGQRHLRARCVPPDQFSELEIAPRSACVVMTHNFLHDLSALRFLLSSPAGYIGMLGPRARTDELIARLREEGERPISPEQLGRVYAPVGLDIGADTPEEIALAILAEIQAVMAGRAGGHLRERVGSIHHNEGKGTGIVVLAAGVSARLGEPKQLLPFEGQSLLRRTVEAALASRCAPVAVVIGANAARMRAELGGLPVRIVQNDDWNLGLSTSVRAGVEALEGEAEAIVFTPCDQPALDAAMLNKLIAAHEDTGKPIVVSAYGEAWGAPMLVARRFWDELKALEGDRGAQPVAYRHAEEVEAVPFPEGACDIDTREDYEALLKVASPALPMKSEDPGEPALRTTLREA
jgi:xanthine/CO dehydrogenase XdhC/CoxF family maturation factor/GTP:adenosylcobinamide-phosphate guanylyltransferase